MAVYTVEIRPRVRKTLRQIDPRARKEVLAKMRAPAADPRPPGTKQVRGHPRCLRVRVGDYRIIYAVDDAARLVTIADVGTVARYTAISICKCSLEIGLRQKAADRFHLFLVTRLTSSRLLRTAWPSTRYRTVRRREK